MEFSIFHMIGHPNPTFQNRIEGLRKDYAVVSTHILQYQSGEFGKNDKDKRQLKHKKVEENLQKN